MTWPLAFTLDRGVISPGDPQLTTWMLDWDWHATLHQPTHLFDANVFYPAKHSLAFSENLYGIAIFVFPLRALGVAPLTAHNIALLFGFFFSAFGAYLLGRTISGCWIAGIAAGIFYAYVPWRFAQMPHIQNVWSGWLPILIVALLHYARTPSWRNAALFGGAFLMNGLTNIHWLLLGSLAIALSVPIAVRAPRDWIRIAVCTLIALALLSPFLIPYARVATLYGMERRWDETKFYSATLRNWLMPAPVRLYERFTNHDVDGELWLFPGVLGIAFSIIGLTRERRDHRAIALLWILLGIIGSLGLHAFFHRFLFAHVPGFRAIRVPARWANIAYVGMSMLIALAASWMASKRRVLAYVVAILFIIELRAAPILWHSVAPDPRPVDRWLATQRARIIELPIGDQFEYTYMFHATAHHRPMANGMSGFVPPETERLTQLWSEKSPELFEELRHIGIDTVIVHADLLGFWAPHTRELLRHELDAGRLQFVGRFDASVEGDWVFALNGPPRPRTEALERFLNKQLTPSSETIALLDYPHFAETIHGNALFSGWAMSPFGIRKVDLLFDNGLVRLPTQLVEDKGLSTGMPWYPQTPRPRFLAGFDKRPPSIREITEVQVEITDGRGHKTLLEGVPITWIR